MPPTIQDSTLSSQSNAHARTESTMLQSIHSSCSCHAAVSQLVLRFTRRSAVDALACAHKAPSRTVQGRVNLLSTAVDRSLLVLTLSEPHDLAAPEASRQTAPHPLLPSVSAGEPTCEFGEPKHTLSSITLTILKTPRSLATDQFRAAVGGA